MKKTTMIKRCFLDTLPVLTGYIVLGMGFGMVLHANGYGIWWALAMTVFIYAGSMQYLTVSILTSGASLIVAAITTLMVNARHLFYGISMIDKYKGAGRKKPYMIFALTDETYSLVCSKESENPEERHDYYFWVSLLNHIYCIIGSVIGSLLGEVVPFSVEGVDFALTALFITIFVEQWMSTKKHAPALVGVAASVGSLLIFGADNFLIPAMCMILLGVTILQKWEDRHHE